jgi:membrane protease YdiL (CAAX protease family)
MGMSEYRNSFISSLSSFIIILLFLIFIFFYFPEKLPGYIQGIATLILGPVITYIVGKFATKVKLIKERYDDLIVKIIGGVAISLLVIVFMVVVVKYANPNKNLSNGKSHGINSQQHTKGEMSPAIVSGGDVTINYNNTK